MRHKRGNGARRRAGLRPAGSDRRSSLCDATGAGRASVEDHRRVRQLVAVAVLWPEAGSGARSAPTRGGCRRARRPRTDRRATRSPCSGTPPPTPRALTRAAEAAVGDDLDVAVGEQQVDQHAVVVRGVPHAQLRENSVERALPRIMARAQVAEVEAALDREADLARVLALGRRGSAASMAASVAGGKARRRLQRVVEQVAQQCGSCRHHRPEEPPPPKPAAAAAEAAAPEPAAARIPPPQPPPAARPAARPGAGAAA